MRALDRWWSEFCACAPLSEEETEEYCLVVVGNKTDLAPSSKGRAVSEGAALSFIDELVPPSGSPSSSLATPEDEGDCMPKHVLDGVPSGSDGEVIAHDNGILDSDTGSPVDIILVDEAHSTVADADNCVSADREHSMPAFVIPPRTPSIDLHSHHHKHPAKARSRASQFSLAPFGTVSSNHTGFTTFHTPGSSFSDGHEPYHSALSSPLTRSRSPSTSPPFHNQRSYRVLSASAMSTSTSIAPTITPARYANDNNLPTLVQTKLPRPPRGPKLFFTSAKTGSGVSEVFDYVARRVVMRWEWEEAHTSASNLVGNYSTVHLGHALTEEKRAFLSACCSS
jgi:Ras-related protein Rab-7A